MDRRIRRTREAIFGAFTELLAKKDFNRITVEEIIQRANIGRATFYSHFETKEYLLKEFCEELFCHIFDAKHNVGCEHRHIFNCDSSDSVVLHLFQHLQKNDNRILTLLSSQNNQLFMQYFKISLEWFVERNPDVFQSKVNGAIPASFWKSFVVSTLVQTIQWWIENGMKESPKVVMEYFFAVIY